MMLLINLFAAWRALGTAFSDTEGLGSTTFFPFNSFSLLIKKKKENKKRIFQSHTHGRDNLPNARIAKE